MTSESVHFLTRRRCVELLVGVIGLSQKVFATRSLAQKDDSPFFRTRGVVLLTEDLTLQDWPARAQKAGLTTIALHDSLSARKVARFANSPQGTRFREQCQKLKIEVEYELHAMSDLLPRELFKKDPSFFRMNEKGERTPDANLCVYSKDALEIAAQNAVELGNLMRPTTHRYFLWGDDGRPWCRCNQCRFLSDSDQSLLVTNHLLQAMRGRDPNAQMAHLAYDNTLLPPKAIKPNPSVFFEFAPINRRYDLPFSKTDNSENRRHLEALDANLELFGRESAQALEYWLDVSRFSQWKRPAKKLPFNPEVFSTDLETYGSRGIRHLTSFAAYIDADYVSRYGDPPLNIYGATLQKWRPT